MQNIIFWRNWSPGQRALYFLIFILLILLGVTIIALELAGFDSLIGWDTFARTETLNIPVSDIKIGPFNFLIEAPAQIFWQFFSGGETFIPIWSYYSFLGITALCFITLTTVITYLERFWYFVGASLLIAALVSLNLELLFLFNTESKEALILALLLYVPATYIFNRVKSTIPFFRRWVFFLLVTVAFGLIIYQFSEVKNPFLYLATSSFYLMMILSVIFTLMVAHEIIIAIIGLLTKNAEGNSSSALRHFLIFCFVYLAILLMAYLKESNIITWELIYINLSILLLISAFLGIWGFSEREPQYSYLMSFKPAGAYFYASMMLASLGTLAHLMLTGNDPGKEVFRDFIVVGHLAFGIVFLLYVLANFIGPLGKNLPVHKILFKPTSMPYFTFRLVGLITFLGFILPAGTSVSVFQTRSAYYNGLGDMYLYGNQPLFALRYYKDGASYGFNNHKSNYSLGKFYANEGAHARAIPYFQRAIRKWPTPQSYVDLANAYVETSRMFDAVFTLKEGMEIFPENYELLNNLGLTFNEVNIIDSAYLFMDRAHELKSDQTTSSSNITGLLIKNEISVDADSVINRYVNPDDPISRNNAFVMKNLQHEGWEIEGSQYDSALSFLKSSVIFNETLNYLYKEDSLPSEELHRYTRYPFNSRYRENLELSESLNLKKDHQVNRAFRLINAMGNRSDDKDYFDIGGKWALDENAPDVAVQYFNWSADRNNPDATFNLAVAYSENHEIQNAITLWQQLANDQEEENSLVAKTMMEVYQTDAAAIMSEDDGKKYLFLRYNTDPLDTARYLKIAETIGDTDLRARAYLYASKYLLERDRISDAINLFAAIAGLQLSDENLYDEIVWHDLELLAASKNIRGLADRINDGVEFDQEHYLEKQYYTALLKATSGDTTALPIFKWVASSNPFREDAVITSANYISSSDRFLAYDLLVSAIEINPNSVRLLKAYILQCAETQLSTYAELSLEELKELLPKKEFDLFYQEYLNRVAEVNEREENFN